MQANVYVNGIMEYWNSGIMGNERKISFLKWHLSLFAP
jgi:hypothetical protein